MQDLLIEEFPEPNLLNTVSNMHGSSAQCSKSYIHNSLFQFTATYFFVLYTQQV